MLRLVARIDAEVKFHTLVSSRQEGVEFLNGDVIRQHQDQNDPTTPVIWSGTVKNYAASRKTIELYSNYIDGSPYTDPTNGFRIGEKIHIENVAGTTAVLLEYGQPGSVNSVVLSKRDNTAYYDSNKNWLQDNIWNNGADLLGGSFVPQLLMQTTNRLTQTSVLLCTPINYKHRSLLTTENLP